MIFSERSAEELYEQFGTDPGKGLSGKHVEDLRTQYGRNELQREKKTPWYVLLGRQFTGILIYILFFAAIVSGVFGEWVDTIAIIVILVLNGILGYIQEAKAQASIESLRKMATAKATVIRNSKTIQVPAEELVPGDILILQTGDKIPADARLIEAVTLQTQEGALTGESTPVTKETGVLEGKRPLGDQKNMVFSGTVITKGRGKAIVVATGMKSEIGKIAHMIQKADVEETPLQKELDRMGGKIGRITLLICAAIFGIILIAQRMDFVVDGWIALKEPFILAISLAVAAIPEGLPIVVTIALAFGTQRMVKKHALIKRLASVETLGSTTVICTDKTGTLTKNEMTVTKVWHAGKEIEIDGTGYAPEGEINGELPDIFPEIAALCNDAELTEQGGAYGVVGDPTEGCLLTLARKAGKAETELREKHPRLAEEPFSSERKRMTTINQFEGGALALTKGAPDIIIQHCTRILDGNETRYLTDEDKKRILETNESFAKDALRVLGFAYRDAEDPNKDPKAYEDDMVFVGLVGMIDPPREEVKDAIARCTTAGIRVVMITGDHKTTAVAIANALGIKGEAVEGKDIADMDLRKRVKDIAVYARVNPEHKMAIVDALKKNGEVVAMTGDGVNDAPALKHADIGVAMGITGTDVSKESAAMILTDDNFTSIVNAVEEGRNIYTNIKKFVNYLLSSNFAEVLVILLAILLFTHKGDVVWPLTATMILYMNLVTDSLPALALGVDPGDPNVMKRSPRDPKEHIISLNMVVNIVLIGALVAGATLITFKYALGASGSLAYAQSVALTTLVVLEIVRLAMIRAQYHTPMLSNKWLYAALGIVFLLQLTVLYTPFGHVVFGAVGVTRVDWAIIVLAAALTYIVGMVLGKLAQKVTGEAD